MTNHEIAQVINEAKPNLKSFWESIDSEPTKIFRTLINEPFSYLNVFKLELLVVLMCTHNRYYFYESDKKLYQAYLTSNSIDQTALIPTSTGYGGYTINDFSNFRLNPGSPHILSNQLILGNAIEPKQYLNSYLRGKLRTSEPTNTAYSKSLQPDLMSFAVFQQWLSTVKPLNSVQASNFIDQINKFPEPIRTQFFDLIMSKCPKPSIDLQHKLSSPQFKFNSDIYQTLPEKYQVRRSANQCISFKPMWDERDSDYKPFTTNVTRTSPANTKEIEYLLGTALVLLQQPIHSDLMISQLIEHATTAEPHLVIHYHSKLTAAHTALTTLLEKYNNGFIQIHSSQATTA